MSKTFIELKPNDIVCYYDIYSGMSKDLIVEKIWTSDYKDGNTIGRNTELNIKFKDSGNGWPPPERYGLTISNISEHTSNITILLGGFLFYLPGTDIKDIYKKVDNFIDKKISDLEDKRKLLRKNIILIKSTPERDKSFIDSGIEMFKNIFKNVSKEKNI